MPEILSKLGIEATNPGVFCGEWLGGGEPLKSVSPIDGTPIGAEIQATGDDYDKVMPRTAKAFES